MELDEVKARIEEELPGARVSIRDFTGGGDHLEARVWWEGFEGMSRVEQHRTVYGALEGLIGGRAPIHALALKTSAELPEEQRPNN